jgi:hypothetical protein
MIVRSLVISMSLCLTARSDWTGIGVVPVVAAAENPRESKPDVEAMKKEVDKGLRQFEQELKKALAAPPKTDRGKGSPPPAGQPEKPPARP